MRLIKSITANVGRIVLHDAKGSAYRTTELEVNQVINAIRTNGYARFQTINGERRLVCKK